MIVIKSVPMVNEISMLAENAGVGTEYITVMIKALGVSYITDFAVDTCKEAGETSLASKASLCGKLAMTGLAIPLIKDMLQISIGILER